MIASSAERRSSCFGDENLGGASVKLGLPDSLGQNLLRAVYLFVRTLLLVLSHWTTAGDDLFELCTRKYVCCHRDEVRPNHYGSPKANNHMQTKQEPTETSQAKKEQKAAEMFSHGGIVGAGRDAEMGNPEIDIQAMCREEKQQTDIKFSTKEFLQDRYGWSAISSR